MMNLNALKIDPEFQGKIPPLNFEEEQQLEQNILHEGRLLNPIIIWNGFILDGHTRYRILRKHPFIGFQIQEIELDNRYAALSWICQNQLGRRNLDPERKKFLMGKLYESEKLARGGSKERAHDENGRFTSMVQNDPLRAKQLSTCERIAAQNGVGAATVKRAEKYAKGVDAAEDAVPGAREEILTGRIKAMDAEITALAKTPKAEIPAALAELRNLEPHLGSEQGGIRPVVVVQNNTANCYSPNLIVAPVTSNTAKKPDHQAHVLVDGNRAFLQPSMILAESVQTISKGRLIRPMGRLSIPELIRLNYALLYQLDLNEWVWRKEAYERYLRYHR